MCQIYYRVTVFVFFNPNISTTAYLKKLLILNTIYVLSILGRSNENETFPTAVAGKQVVEEIQSRAHGFLRKLLNITRNTFHGYICTFFKDLYLLVFYEKRLVLFLLVSCLPDKGYERRFVLPRSPAVFVVRQSDCFGWCETQFGF